jgi:hypothetical protein
VVGALGVSALAASPAYAENVGYVRVAHLAPDCVMVDVYIVSQSGAIPAKIIPSVNYGRVSDYMALPSGAYAVALRDAGAPASAQPELATQLTVEPGKAYTVAALGKRADLGARVPGVAGSRGSTVDSCRVWPWVNSRRKRLKPHLIIDSRAPTDFAGILGIADPHGRLMWLSPAQYTTSRLPALP